MTRRQLEDSRSAGAVAFRTVVVPHGRLALRETPSGAASECICDSAGPYVVVST